MLLGVACSSEVCTVCERVFFVLALFFMSQKMSNPIKFTFSLPHRKKLVGSVRVRALVSTVRTGSSNSYYLPVRLGTLEEPVASGSTCASAVVASVSIRGPNYLLDLR